MHKILNINPNNMKEFYIYSIGHGAKSMQDLMDELIKYDIKYLIDVRSKPFSKYYPHFNKETLINFFQKRDDIKYSWWGETIGGMPPAGWNCYTSDGKIDYDKMALNPIFINGVDRITNANAQCLKTAIMCSESEPQMCHRSKLIGRMLEDRGVEMQHIVRNKRGDIITKSQKTVFVEIVNDNTDLFSQFQDTHDIHLTSRKSYV